jgi:hypothetical protein
MGVRQNRCEMRGVFSCSFKEGIYKKRPRLSEAFKRIILNEIEYVSLQN